MSINFTRRTDYALVALARLSEVALGSDRPMSARQLAKDYDLPEHLLMNLMKRLHEVGLLESRRGVGGGYWLARPAGQITVAEVVEAIEGTPKLALCCGGEESESACQNCRVEPNCPITESVRHLNQRVIDMLRGVSIEDLRTPRVTPPTRRPAPQPMLQLTTKAG